MISNKQVKNMLSVISPAKSLNFESISKEIESSYPSHLSKSQEIIEVVKKLNDKQIKDLMNISQDLAQLNYDRFQNWSLSFNEDNAKQAVFSFNGGVYKGLDVNTFSQQELSYAQKHLRIISGLYGLLKPLDLIQPYRLEMGTKLSVKASNNLYNFWKETITNSINKDLEKNGHQFFCKKRKRINGFLPIEE